MSAEAESRGFYSAERRAFLGDGLKDNWSIQQQHFETFAPILDFIHPVERLHEVSRVLHRGNAQAAWEANLKWIELCWSDDVAAVIGLLQAEQHDVGYPAQNTPEDAPKFKLMETIGYLQNNVSRMDYPAYRQAGLPTSSCLIESQVKEMNHRVKGVRSSGTTAGEARRSAKSAQRSSARASNFMTTSPSGRAANTLGQAGLPTLQSITRSHGSFARKT